MSYERRPDLCMCCRQPLTLVQKLVTLPLSESNPARETMQESWDCTNEACIIYRRHHPKIPTPPLSK